MSAQSAVNTTKINKSSNRLHSHPLAAWVYIYKDIKGNEVKRLYAFVVLSVVAVLSSSVGPVSAEGMSGQTDEPTIKGDLTVEMSAISVQVNPDGSTPSGNAESEVQHLGVELATLNQGRSGPDEQLSNATGATGRARTHLRQQMRGGANVSSEEIDVIGVDVAGSGALYLVQAIADQVVALDAYIADAPPGGQDVSGGTEIAFDIGWAESDLQTQKLDVRTPGFNAARSSSARRQGRGSRTVFFNPAYSSSNNVDHWVTTNWEKWQSKTESKDWGYNRYATFDPANGGIWSTSKLGYSQGMMIDATIRSRPWKTKKDRVVGGPFDYVPRPEESCRTTATLDLKLGDSAGISVPVVNCYSSLEIYPNGNKHSMGAAWYGKTKSQRHIDFAYDIRSNGETPIMADYVWMSVIHCYTLSRNGSCSFPYGSSTRHYKWSESGY